MITERLELRPLPPDAAQALLDDREAAALMLESTLSPAWPLPDLFDVLPRQSDGPFGIWVMIELRTGVVVGDVGFKGPPAERTVEIGCSVVPDRRGRGYATEAARALVEWALSQSGVDAVVATCERENVPSIRTLERSGFARTSETADEIHWRFEIPGGQSP